MSMWTSVAVFRLVVVLRGHVTPFWFKLQLGIMIVLKRSPARKRVQEHIPETRLQRQHAVRFDDVCWRNHKSLISIAP